ncbi:MAG: VWA domain-containing protein [Prevotellaceae bacterium]|nr:VWA domain-containing protein [Prevotellaceae bacterium]
MANISDLTEAFAQIQFDIMREINSLYSLNYLSPKRGSDHNLQLNITGNTNSNASATVSVSFSAANFTSADYGLYVKHKEASGIYGITEGSECVVQNNDTLRAVSYWSDTVPHYEWSSSDPSVVQLESEEFGNATLRLAGSGTAIITVKDAGNYNYVKEGRNTTIAPAHAAAFVKMFRVQTDGTTALLTPYKAHLHTVTFDTDGGVPVPQPQQIENGGVAVQPAIAPAKQGYKFIGWYEGGTAWNFSGGIGTDVTLTAQWEEQTQWSVCELAASGIGKDSVLIAGRMAVEDAADYLRAVCYSTAIDPDLEGSHKIVEATDEAFTLQLKNLSPNTTYYMRGVAYKAGQDTIYGNNVAFTTRASNEYYVLRGWPPIATRKPSFVDVMVSVKDRDNKGADYLENDDFVVTENGDPLSSESNRYIRKMDAIPFKIKTVLMLDNSSSLGYRGIEQMKQAAVELVKNKSDKQEFAIFSFSENEKLEHSFTSDIHTLVQRISEIEMGHSSTCVYTSYERGMRWLNDYPEYSSKDSIQKSFFIMISDGDETTHKYSTSHLNAAVSARGSKTAYMIGLGQDLKTDRLTALASSSANYYKAENVNGLRSIFVRIQNDIIREANSFYNLTYQSAKQDIGAVKLRLSVNRNSNSSSNGYYEATFESTGFETALGGVYLNAYQKMPDVSTPNGRYGIGLPDNATSAQRRDTIEGVFSLPDEFALQAVTYWADVNPHYVWSTSDASVLTLDSLDIDKVALAFAGESDAVAVITVKDVANYDLVASGKARGMDSGYKDFFVRSLRVTRSSTGTTIQEIPDAQVLVYPNPTPDYLYIKGGIEVEQVRLLDMSGNVQYAANGKVDRIDLTGFASGVYILLIKSKQGVFQQKIVKLSR